MRGRENEDENVLLFLQEGRIEKEEWEKRKME
jgi:hypothetical protein